MANAARRVLDQDRVYYPRTDFPDTPVWESHTAFLGTGDELCPCRGQIAHGSNVESDDGREDLESLLGWLFEAMWHLVVCDTC
jgi:hypothetical protein